MKDLQQTTSLKWFESEQELQEHDLELYVAAKNAANNAYAAYSGFHVGCALRLDDNSIFIGNNQENVAFPSGLCAERVALFAAKANHPDKSIKSIAIYAYSEHAEHAGVVSPCGGCRQVMIEYEQNNPHPIPVFMPGPNHTIYMVDSVAALLPFFFESKAVKKQS